MRAFRILNDNFGNSYFQEGTLPEYTSINCERFIIQTKIEEYQKHQHPAPREQYVVTLKGKLLFTTSDGNQFVLEPGILLIAKDIYGEGHSWEIIEGNEWHRVYIIPNHNSDDEFVLKEN